MNLAMTNFKKFLKVTVHDFNEKTPQHKRTESKPDKQIKLK